MNISSSGALKVLLPVLALLALTACDSSSEHPYHGYLYFGKGPYVMQFALRDGGLSVVSNLGNKTIREISTLGEGKLLIAETAPVNRKQVARISWLDLKTGQSESLYAGIKARFLAGARVIIYDDGEKLYSVYLAGDSEIDSVILSHRRNQLTAMVDIAGHSLLLEMQEDGQPVVQHYHPVTGELRSLSTLAGLCRLEGAVWVDDLKQLACRERGADGSEGGYILAGLDGNRVARLSLPEEGKFLALAYVGNQGALVFRQSRPSTFGGQEKFAVWAHDVHTGENTRLSDTQNLGSSAVYTDY